MTDVVLLILICSVVRDLINSAQASYDHEVIIFSLGRGEVLIIIEERAS